MSQAVSILVHTPAHSGLGGPLTYLSEQALAPGTLVRVPLGTRETLGVVWDNPATPASVTNTNASLGVSGGLEKTEALNFSALKQVTSVLTGLPELNPAWRDLVRFAAAYYQRSLGEVALSALPPQLRDLDSTQLARRLKSPSQAGKPKDKPSMQADGLQATGDVQPPLPALTPEQTAALAAMAQHPGPYLLFGATGSGKTEVYLRRVAEVLAQDPQAQALVMVPEINLTPQLEERFNTRFAAALGAGAVVAMHSGMTAPQRLKSWLAAHQGRARIVLGTRMAVFASMPHLRLIVVDEEHDPSYKQQEGARYSARDLAIYRGKLEGLPVILGSATPSLETWYHSRPDGGRYLRILMPSRVGLAPGKPNSDPNAPPRDLPLVRRVDMNHQPKRAVFSPPLVEAIKERVSLGEQVMVLLNRRGYAPVLACSECDWKSDCPYCSAYRVFHKIDRSLRCHHCGLAQPVPRACPSCGNPDITPLGRGTERLEEHLAELLTEVRRPDPSNPAGAPVRIARIDADSTRLKGELASQLAQVHAGDVDVLVGTQMIAKGHDFRRITLVAAVNPDGALFSSDFRAPERLFSLLMQSAGRAGRDAALRGRSEMWVQTFHPAHPLFAALKQHDYPAFAASQLQEREQAGLPPFSFQALVRSDARTQDSAQGFLQAASQAGAALAEQLGVTLYPAVPLSIQRVANVERAQMLMESASRAALQKFLAAWQDTLHATRASPAGKGVIRWAVDVDPLAI
jgi:primosomal protein N' (replication factor Y)